jgi:hypothetical protein
MIVWLGNMQARQLTELYRALRLYVNCFQPSMKLLAKQRDGKKVRYVYDLAKTPLQRSLLLGVLPAQKQQELLEVAQALDPIRLLHQLEQLQQAVFRCAVSCSPCIPSLITAPICVFSLERWLVANPERSSGDIFRELQRRSPGRYQPLQIRTREPRDAQDTSLPAGSAGGAMARGSDPGTIALASFC